MVDTEEEKQVEETYFERHIDELKQRRDTILSGGINSIPLKFDRFRKWLPGIEKRKYTIITANQKVGKSKYADDNYIYHPFFYSLEHPEKVRFKAIYFSLEMGKKEKFNEFLSHLLMRLDEIRISPSDLKSTNNEHPVPAYILELLESERYQYYIRKFEEAVMYVEHEKNPTGIDIVCRDFAATRGKVIMSQYTKTDSVTGLKTIREKIDHYVPNDPDEYVIVILDNYSNLVKQGGMNTRENIENLSKRMIALRDLYDFTIVAVQHQAQAQEGLANFKEGKLKPSPDGLADAKTTVRDANLALGLFSPFKHGIQTYEGYDITKFKNRIRFLEIMEDRDNGGSGQMCPLFFDGASSVFYELPLPTDTVGLAQIYKYMETMDDPVPQEKPETIKINKA